LKLISEINEEAQLENDTDKYSFFLLNGFVSRIKYDGLIYYDACINEKCRKKVVEENQGYRCDKCQKLFATSKPTYMITAKITDFTDSIYVTFAREHGETLMSKYSTK